MSEQEHHNGSCKFPSPPSTNVARNHSNQRVFSPQWKDEVRSHDPRLQRSGKHTDTTPELDITLKKLWQNSKERPV